VLLGIADQTHLNHISLIHSLAIKPNSGAIVIIQQIVAVLTAERNLLDRAISALNGISPQP